MDLTLNFFLLENFISHHQQVVSGEHFQRASNVFCQYPFCEGLVLASKGKNCALGNSFEIVRRLLW